MVLDLTWLSYACFAVVAYYGLLFLLSLRRREESKNGSENNPVFVLVIPAHNEEAVIGPTLRSLTSLGYSDRLILVMNDGSSDRTSEIARSYEPAGVLVVDRDADIAGKGKGAVLNHSFGIISQLVEDGHPSLCGRTARDVVVGIVDADGQLEHRCLSEVAPYFDDPAVGGAQIGVRIVNATTNILTRMQDLEFVGFSAFVQEARDRFGSVGLGGNGQFTRLSALQSLGRDPWTDCLSEDLELGLSLVEAGWRVRYCPTTFVSQQGLTSWRPLLRQRTRWLQGHYQCWRHLPGVWRAKGVPRRTRFDLSIYLLMVCFIMLVVAGVVASMGAAAGLFVVENNSLGWITNGHVHNLAMLAISFAPLAAFLFTYQRRSWSPLRFWELPAFAVAFSLYAYLFAVSQLWAWLRIATGRGNWAKTPRLSAEPVSG